MIRQNRQRGFTLIEVLLASALGGLIVAGCVGMFALIANSDKRTSERAQETFELSLVHQTTQKAVRLLVMDSPSFLGTGESTPGQRGRIILEQDGEKPWQRLELVVNEPPVQGSTIKDPIARVFSKYAAVRGAFELRPSRLNDQELLLYWVNYVPGGAETREIGSETLLATNLKTVRWKLAKTGDEKKLVRLEQASIGNWTDMPAYLEMGVETLSGQRFAWMFEFGWSVVAKPNVGGIAGMFGGSDDPTASPDTTRTPESADSGSGSGSTRPGQMDQGEFLRVMVNALRGINAGNNTALRDQLLRQYEQQLRDWTEAQTAAGRARQEARRRAEEEAQRQADSQGGG
jgi:prepilin-type N-terminal cleavage/methylation domain-containing protein